MRILFVCMGNICRSPSAEGVFRRVLVNHTLGAQIQIDSAGTHDYHIGQPPDRRSIDAAQRRGVDISQLNARQVIAQDFERFDLVLAMDQQNYEYLRAMAPVHLQSRIRLFMEFAPEAALREVPDPYYGGAAGFERVLDLLEEASAGLLAHLEELHRQ